MRNPPSVTSLYPFCVPQCPHWSLWPLPSMALLALSLTLLAMTVATTAITMIPLDLPLDSFDDQYQGCGPEMKAALPALKRSEFQKNPLFAEVWASAVKEWQRRGSRVSPLSSSDQAIAIMAYTTNSLHKDFNHNVSLAGRYRGLYQDYFHFKVLHFLLTDALATLRDAQGKQCHCVVRWPDKHLFKAKLGDIVGFGQFASASLCKNVTKGFESTMMLQAWTCHGAYIKNFSRYPFEDVVVIPPFEKFKVTKVTKKGENMEIHLDSIGTYSQYNCEWLKGGSIPRATCQLGGLLLATTVLAMATGIL
ncbi:erythroblast NAD(P)(+)--arginine ADP-ribosyltransferase-like isoform X2 [Oenanthe melanoleuca]|uniref:erythroblast NAD(P)(+)--arginine ADP-ribosyltransferase-like isoform X2 n=2 Tax=Oenanthe melanoleuca TaxID=2939378 RepID=UPI0024C13B4D|nr:erythroblast NAD(P)(+)--arginine ADP-ribosyltransferase-like isoform X2 [Oenanthe melanoleuca]